jgi:hypothetical protein
MVPLLVVCHKCGAILSESIDLETPDEIIQPYDGKCPACRKKLSYIPIDYEIKPVEEKSVLHARSIRNKESV